MVRIVWLSVIPILTVYFSISAWILHTTKHPWLVILTGLLLIGTTFAQQRNRRLIWLQALALGLFHYFSQLNWCMALYMFIAFQPLIRIPNQLTAFAVACFFLIEYCFIQLTFVPFTLKEQLLLAPIWITTLALMILIRKTLKNEEQRGILQQEKSQFSTSDSLTGLHNYQKYHKRLTELITKNRPFQLILVDCQNFKSLNIERGFKAGNEVLVRIATLLRTHLHAPLLLARIGGDQFAIAIDPTKTKREDVHQLLEQTIPSLLGLNLRFGIGMYPENGKKKDEVMAAAESELFMKKRDSWLKREEALFRSEKLRAVGEMAAGMAHEIRNPLTTIKGFLQVSRYNGYQIGPYYETIMSEISRMSELTAEFLQFSRPHVIQYKDQSLQECLDRVLSLTESEASLQGHQMHVEKPAKPILVRVDRDRIVQVILNLIKNAFEAMNTPGTVTITLSRSHEYATLRIRDTGIGIPEANRDAIFQPFFTSKEKGTGLGLSICQKIIQDHDGMIDVWSEQNQGTLFTIQLPLSSSFVETNTELRGTK